jgi:hypothetical protein
MTANDHVGPVLVPHDPEPGTFGIPVLEWDDPISPE